MKMRFRFYRYYQKRCSTSKDVVKLSHLDLTIIFVFNIAASVKRDGEALRMGIRSHNSWTMDRCQVLFIPAMRANSDLQE